MNLKATREGGWYRFAVLDLGNEHWTPSTFFPQLDSAMDRVKMALSEEPTARILFDLSALTTVDSSLITLVVQTIRLSGTGRVSVIVANPDVYSWLALLGIDRLADIFNSEQEWREKQDDSQP
ncbi:MAG TPA: STAS domain-containing protein [Chitinivibrionales bacterium]|jgi:anti-anti-sigma regulatory factor|nr:STAS domain-containing protein [Chitinivibrionales bacterium]